MSKKRIQTVTKNHCEWQSGAMGRLGWGWQQNLKISCRGLKKIFFLATFSSSPSPIAPSPHLLWTESFYVSIFLYIEIIID
jgi:hypothetical protein